MDRHQVFELQRAGLEAFIRATAHASEGGRLAELDGVVGAVIPACAERSLPNSVVWRDVGSLRAALGELAAAYDQAGVAAWTVWVPEGEDEAAELLESSGHRFDGSPAAMYMRLADLAAPAVRDLDWDAAAEPAEVGRVNDLAYGFPVGKGPGPAIGHGPAELGTRLYRARVGGETVSVMQTLDVGDDCVVTMVATLPDHRGRGLAGRLLWAALAEARERGLVTSTLQASILGAGIYERIGYGVAGRLRLYERRR